MIILIHLLLSHSRVDYTLVLFRSYFSYSLRSFGQMISHRYVTVKVIKDKSYLLKPGDLISIDPNYCHVIQNNLKKLLFESKLDSVLYRSKFSSSLTNSEQLLSHGCIMVKKSY